MRPPTPMNFHGRGLVLALLAGLLLGAPQARGEECGQVDRELSRARDFFSQIQDRVERCDVPHARGLLEQAGRALRDAQKESRGGRCRRAGLQIEAARGLIDRAMKLCSQTDRQQDQVAQFLQETDRLIQNLKDLHHGPSAECGRMIKVCEDQQQNAWRQFRAGKPRFALSLSGGARKSIETARRCLGGGGIARASLVERYLETTDRFLKHAEEILGSGHDGVDRARGIQSRAWAKLKDDQVQQAFRFSDQSRRLAANAVSTFSGAASGQSIQGMALSVVDYINELKALDLPRPDRRALERAEEQVKEARDLLSSNRPAEAFSRLQAAMVRVLQVAEARGVSH